MPALLPTDEAVRLAALHDCQILDTPPEAAFERIVNLASRALDIPLAAISFVDRDRQWFKARVGLPVCETPRETSFCAHAILGDDVMVVPDAAADPRFADNPLVTGKPGVRFYAGAPLRTPGGQALGALGVFDRRPRRLSGRQRRILSDLAAMVIDELSLRTEVAARQDAEVNQALRSEIHQRQLADDQCRASERRFRQLFNQASDAAMVHDMEGWLVDVNEAACTMLGYTRGELLKMNVRDFAVDHVPSGGLPLWRELPAGSMEKFECLDRRKDGGLFVVEVQITVLDMAEGRHLLALIRDLTERKRAEELLHARIRQQEAVARLGTRALSGGSVDELLHEATVLVGETLGIDMCRVYEHLPEQRAFVVRASLLPGDQDVGKLAPGDDIGGYGGYILHTSQPTIVEDVATETRFTVPASIEALGVKSTLGVLIGGANPGDLRFGLLGVGHRQQRAFNENDVFFVQSVANVLAAAIVRRRQEDDLRAVEARYQRIAAHTPGVVYQYLLRADGTLAIPFISEGCRTLFGRGPDEIQADPRIVIESVHPADRPGFVEAIHASKSTLSPLHWQGRYSLPDGEARWMRVDSRPERQPDGGVICDGIIIDITGQKQRKEALRQSEERFRLAIRYAPFPILLHASDGEVIKINDAWTRLTGYQEADLRTVQDWITRACPPEEWAELRASLDHFGEHDGILERPGRRIRCADGSERIWDFTRANLDRLPDGRCLHITTAVDVTERHQGEAALRAAKEEAERADRAKSVFLSRMSHELRTPLNAILGFGQLLELSTLNAQDAMALSYILKGGRHLLALIDEVLDLSRVETGVLHLSREHVNVGALARECVGLVARMALARGITCRVAVPPEASLWIDEQRLRQMLLNLLSNAVKYNREGGDVLVSSEETTAGSLRLEVRDTGPGIPPAGLTRLFVPFERLEQEFGEAEGTGLGLVISRRIAEAMGGSLEVESTVGEGSTFWIELPLAALPVAAPPAAAAAAPAEPPPVRAAGPAANATLLYIEDNHSNSQVVKALLTNCRPHWQFLSATNGLDGLEQARQRLPGLILLDLQLPGMKGDAVLEALRGDPRTQHLPVVLLSADATPHSRERLLALGADDYISKPFKVEALLDLLDRTLLNAAVNHQPPGAPGVGQPQ